MAYSVIKKPSDYFNTLLWNGNNSGTTREITGVGFTPDFIWSKRRGTSGSHQLYDTIRGTQNVLQTDSTTAQITSNVNGAITTLGSDGYTWTNGSDGVNPRYYFNESDTYCSWNWKANGTGAANTDGSINSTVSANTTSGFSIVSYTGNGANNDTATIGHGLGVAPNMIMVKPRNAAGGWQTSSTSLGWNNVLELQSTAAQASGTYAFGVSGVTPNTNTFTVSATSGGNHTNTNGNNYIAYCFAEKQGFSKFGSYTGNGSADGTFVYTGFKPAFVMFKNATTASTNWHIVDDKRNTANVVDKLLFPNDSGLEATQTSLDFTSNGFKIRTLNGYINTSGNNYIYMAFAEQPLVGDNPATAR